MAGRPQVMSRQDVRQLSVVDKGLEILDWVYYDTLAVPVAAAPTNYTFFQQSVGQSGITKETTNMEIPGQLPASYVFVLQKAVWEALPALSAALAINAAYLSDYLALTHVGSGVINIGTRPYFESPLKTYIGGQAQGFAATGDAGTPESVSYVQGRTVINAELEYAISIPANYAFNFTATFPAAPVPSAAARVRMNFVGKLIRPKQG